MQRDRECSRRSQILQRRTPPSCQVCRRQSGRCLEDTTNPNRQSDQHLGILSVSHCFPLENQWKPFNENRSTLESRSRENNSKISSWTLFNEKDLKATPPFAWRTWSVLEKFWNSSRERFHRSIGRLISKRSSYTVRSRWAELEAMKSDSRTSQSLRHPLGRYSNWISLEPAFGTALSNFFSSILGTHAEVS